jgi:hypothetical protein
VFKSCEARNLYAQQPDKVQELRKLLKDIKGTDFNSRPKEK